MYLNKYYHMTHKTYLIEYKLGKGGVQWEKMSCICERKKDGLSCFEDRSDSGMNRAPFLGDGVKIAEERFFRRESSCAINVKRGKNMGYQESPCLTCDRVKKPQDCENKNCRLWRQWFTVNWDRARSVPALQRELKRGGPETINIGGTRYVHPDRVREYLKLDPCLSCPFPRELCASPCPAKRTWMDVKEEVEKNELEK